MGDRGVNGEGFRVPSSGTSQPQRAGVFDRDVPGRVRVPYIAPWSTEEALPTTVVQRGGLGIGFADETFADRDEHGILWRRIPSRPGRGRPLFGEVHPLRQRRAMRRLLCNVCASPADHNDQGVLWLVRDHRDDWPDWPNEMAVTEPPVCLPCAHQSVRACPALRQGYAALRVGNCPVGGVYGVRYQPGRPDPITVTDEIVALEDPLIRWTVASQLIRHLTDCTIIDLDLV
jgi:hypothetical protein